MKGGLRGQGCSGCRLHGNTHAHTYSLYRHTTTGGRGHRDNGETGGMCAGSTTHGTRCHINGGNGWRNKDGTTDNATTALHTHTHTNRHWGV